MYHLKGIVRNFAEVQYAACAIVGALSAFSLLFPVLIFAFISSLLGSEDRQCTYDRQTVSVVGASSVTVAQITITVVYNEIHDLIPSIIYIINLF